MEEYNYDWADYYHDDSEEQRVQRFNFARMIADDSMQNDILCTIMSPPDTLTPEARVRKMTGGHFTKSPPMPYAGWDAWRHYVVVLRMQTSSGQPIGIPRLRTMESIAKSALAAVRARVRSYTGPPTSRTSMLWVSCRTSSTS